MNVLSNGFRVSFLNQAGVLSNYSFVGLNAHNDAAKKFNYLSNCEDMIEVLIFDDQNDLIGYTSN